MFSNKKERDSKKDKEEHDKLLRKALADKCADMGSQYASHQEDETEYTVVTINGKSIKVKKEEITIASVTDLKLTRRKY